jgi:hypothetical protein
MSPEKKCLPEKHREKAQLQQQRPSLLQGKIEQQSIKKTRLV